MIPNLLSTGESPLGIETSKCTTEHSRCFASPNYQLTLHKLKFTALELKAILHKMLKRLDSKTSNNNFTILLKAMVP